MTPHSALRAVAAPNLLPPPERLTLRCELQGDAVCFSYTTSAGDRGGVRIRYGFEVDAAFLPGIGMVVAVYLGQLALAARLELDVPVDEHMARDVLPLAAMLYDIRRWKDDQPFGAPPTIEGATGPTATATPQTRQRTGSSLLLWSGGKDSSLSALLLADNGYRTQALHITANAGVEAEEAGALARLSDRLGLPTTTVQYTHREFLEFSSKYALNWNKPPLCNTVPFGRDLLLSALAAPVLHHLGISHLSLGHDHECRNAYVEASGRRVPRNDVESVEGALAMEHYLSRHVLQGLRLLPPVSGLSELRILQEMLVRHGEVMRDAAFCFWGGNCGRCAKCLRYYLAQRLFEVDVIEFRTNPVGDDGAPEMDDLLDIGRQGVLFQQQVLVCAARIVERGDIRAEETRLGQFAATVYPRIADRIDAWELELLEVGTDPQLPEDWRYPPAPRRGSAT